MPKKDKKSKTKEPNTQKTGQKGGFKTSLTHGREFYQEIGRKGGLKGGKARSEKLTPKERSDIAKKAAQARWKAKA